MKSDKNILKAGNFGEDIHKYTRRYTQLKKRRDAIDSEMSEIRSYLSKFIDSNEVDGIEDRYYRVIKSIRNEQRIDKDKFIKVFGETELPRVCKDIKSVRILVKSKSGKSNK